MHTSQNERVKNRKHLSDSSHLTPPTHLEHVWVCIVGWGGWVGWWGWGWWGWGWWGQGHRWWCQQRESSMSADEEAWVRAFVPSSSFVSSEWRTCLHTHKCTYIHDVHTHAHLFRKTNTSQKQIHINKDMHKNVHTKYKHIHAHTYIRTYMHTRIHISENT